MKLLSGRLNVQRAAEAPCWTATAATAGCVCEREGWEPSVALAEVFFALSFLPRFGRFCLHDVVTRSRRTGRRSCHCVPPLRTESPPPPPLSSPPRLIYQQLPGELLLPVAPPRHHLSIQYIQRENGCFEDSRPGNVT